MAAFPANRPEDFIELLNALSTPRRLPVRLLSLLASDRVSASALLTTLRSTLIDNGDGSGATYHGIQTSKPKSPV